MRFTFGPGARSSTPYFSAKRAITAWLTPTAVAMAANEMRWQL
jgi:hypothetical protein